MERRLAAVLIADVVGYGRLSQIDEEGTRARFQADLKEIFEPKIAAYRGRLIKTMGDGLLVEFPSVVDALRCAVEVAAGEGEAQRRRAARAAARLPHRRQPRRRHRRGRRHPRRRRQHRRPHAGARRAGRRRHLRHRLRPGEGEAAGRLRLARRAEGQEHRRAGAGLPRACMDPAAAGKTVAAPKHGLRVWRVAGGSRGDRRPGCWLARRVVAAVAAGGRSATANVAAADDQAVARRAALRQSERRRRAGLSRRRHHRGSDDGAGAHPRPLRDLAQRRLHLQGQGSAAGADRHASSAFATSWKAASAAPATTCASMPSSSTRRPAAICGPSASTAPGATCSRCRTRSSRTSGWR